MSQLIDLTKYDEYFKNIEDNWDIFSFIHTEKFSLQVILPNGEVIYVSPLFKYNLVKSKSPFVSATSQKLDKPNHYELKVDMPLQIPILDYVRFAFLMSQESYEYMKWFIMKLDNMTIVNLLYVFNAYAPLYSEMLFISIYNNLKQDIFLPDLKYPSNIIIIENVQKSKHTEKDKRIVANYCMLLNLHILEESLGIIKKKDNKVKEILEVLKSFVKYYPYYLYKNSYFLDIETIYDYFDLSKETDVFEAWVNDDEKTLLDIQDVKTHKDIEITYYKRDHDSPLDVITVKDVAKKSGIELNRISVECQKYIFNKYNEFYSIHVPYIYIRRPTNDGFESTFVENLFRNGYDTQSIKDIKILDTNLKRGDVVFKYERAGFDIIKEGIIECFNKHL